MTAPAPAPAPLELLELVRVRMPLVRPFRTSFGTQTTRDVLLVHVRTAGTDGWGECTTPDAPIYSSEYTDGAAAVIADHLGPRLLGAGELVAADVRDLLAPVKGHRMAKAALEIAVMDAELRAAGVALVDAIGGVRDRVPTGVSVGIPEGGTPALVEEVGAWLDAGYLRIKLKIEPGFDLEPVAAVRTEFPDATLQVDANAAYGPGDVEHLMDLDDLDLVLIEQPFAPGRLLDHARLAERLETPVCLDESLTSAAAAGQAIELQACEVANLKVGRVGGILESIALHDVCRSRGIDLWCGGMLESGIGRAVNVALAALPGMTLPGDTSASDRYWETDLTDPFVLHDGHVPVPAGPGIGVAPIPDILDELTIARRPVEP